ncbi:MAG: monooxygenase [Cryptosporangiaceae bacterium]|jgi:hypothetical protein|nr:monooxygenase [Cryptosporangiaceae bacterium]
MSDPHDEHDDGYTGPAQVLVGGAAHDARAVLGARFEPVAGRVVWYGRLEGVPELLGARAEVRVRTPHGEGDATITEQDLWGHWHLRSESAPPFAVEILEESPSR